jgi:hypothetical protein
MGVLASPPISNKNNMGVLTSQPISIKYLPTMRVLASPPIPIKINTNRRNEI